MPNGSRFSNKFHQIKVFNAKITKFDSFFSTVRLALKRKISRLTELFRGTQVEKPCSSSKRLECYMLPKS